MDKTERTGCVSVPTALLAAFAPTIAKATDNAAPFVTICTILLLAPYSHGLYRSAYFDVRASSASQIISFHGKLSGTWLGIF